MKLFSVAIVLAMCVAVASADVFSTRTAIPEGWSKGLRAAPEMPFRFGLALHQRNLDVLEARFNAITDPKSPEYQNYWSIEQVHQLIAPKPSDKARVLAWLDAAGVTDVVDNGDYMQVTTTVATTERLFSTELFAFTHKETGKVVHKQMGAMSAPASVLSVVEMVVGISTFPVPKLRTIVQAERPLDNQGVIAQTLYGLYNIPSQKHGGANVSQSVIEFQGQSYSPSQLAAYATSVNIPVDPLASNHIVGPNNPSFPQVEATLDIQLITTVNVEATNWFWLEPGNGWLYLFGQHFFNTQDVPEVNSISYGWSESDQCQVAGNECNVLGVDSQQFVARVNTEFMKIGGRGVTLLVASGDSGANGRTDPMCTASRLRPSFPAASPYVTTVGATQLNQPQFNLPNPPPICSQGFYQCASGGTEVAVSYSESNFASGGGFSDYSARPDWQKAAVEAYFNSGAQMPPSTMYNNSNRGYPDVAAIGHNTLINTGSTQAVGGTSASCPIFAAVVSMLNNVVKAKTGKTIGFANPLLYQMWKDDPSLFQDITVGDNHCTEQGCGFGNCKGYYCTKGWDPVTGLGSPNAAKMLQYVQNMNYPNPKRA